MGSDIPQYPESYSATWRSCHGGVGAWWCRNG
jgi:hypothetical protein